MIRVKMREPIIPPQLKAEIEKMPQNIKDMIVAVVLADYMKQAESDISLFIPDTIVWFTEQIQKYGFTVEYESA